MAYFSWLMMWLYSYTRKMHAGSSSPMYKGIRWIQCTCSEYTSTNIIFGFYLQHPKCMGRDELLISDLLSAP